MEQPTNLDLDLLRAFVTVAEAGGFTRAAERLGRSQPAVSLQIRRLEDQLGSELFDRSGREVAPTGAGDALLPKARRLLRVNDEIVSTLRETQVEGEVRFGAPEDVATAFLPRILGDFARARPRVSLAVTCDFTVNLLDQISRGALDLALVKREPLSPELGDGVRREPLVWVAADEEIARARVIPLIAAPAPDVYRKRAIAALNAYGSSFRVAYTSPSLAGQHAALRAGLGVAALPADMVPKDLTVLGAAMRLPPLEDTEIAVVRAKGARGAAVDLLAEEVVRSLAR